ncbi:hypothetical protein [Novosphingobium sp. ST904]|uniref:hypothetical protein n=1 Tax=Novosphingobium sp. ST904 TaxID=1684385 RepID=UPI001046CF4D|nr:hypothetical protein [Novosphingobium sp. ST904]
MSFIGNLGRAFRAVNEGRATAHAHRTAEAFLGAPLPSGVAEEGFRIVGPMADFSSVEEMAMIYVIIYAEQRKAYLDGVNATKEFRGKIARQVANACIALANLQRGGERFNSMWTIRLINAARGCGVKVDHPKIAFKV